MTKTESLQIAMNDPEIEFTDEAQSALLAIASNPDNFSEDMQWIRNISASDRKALEKTFTEVEFEPDFYHMAREKFTHWYMVLVYLLFFAVLGLHLRHGFSSAFQTLGLNNYKYNKAIEIIGIIYTWCICLIFSLVALGVFIPSL
jgi:succinate dehydrogenase/fumarate reductase cytochrome b subunit (b558 family)